MRSPRPNLVFRCRFCGGQGQIATLMVRSPTNPATSISRVATCPICWGRRLSFCQWRGSIRATKTALKIRAAGAVPA